MLISKFCLNQINIKELFQKFNKLINLLNLTTIFLLKQKIDIHQHLKIL